jgi:phosphoesterase RecJ-like protein
MWQDAEMFIGDHHRFLITTHIHPEGDAVGSEIAVAHFLKDLGKEAVMVNSSATPANCLFLPLAPTIKVYPGEYTADLLDRADAVVIVDVNNWEHVGPFGGEIRKSLKRRLCIDHHQDAEEEFAHVTVNDPRAAAAGVMVYDFIKHMRGEITRPIAEALYTAIVTDTGWFRFSNTDERVFRAATDLCTKGIDPFAIYRQVSSRRWGALKLIGTALSTLDRTPDGKIAWIHVTQKMFDEAGAEYEDGDGLLELIRPLAGVELCVIFKEIADGKVKVSVRSNGKINAFTIAKRHGGGGHRMAAGLTVDGPMTPAIETFIAECAADAASVSR